MAYNWAGCQMKGISVTQVDISGARESACDCKTALCCLHVNTHVLCFPVTHMHTHFGQLSDHQPRTEEKRGNRKGRKQGEAEQRPSLAR